MFLILVLFERNGYYPLHNICGAFNKYNIIRRNITVLYLLHNFRVLGQTTVAYTPEQNGKVERDKRTIVEAVRTMICTKNLDVSLWAEAVNTAVYTINLTGTSSQDGKPPYELYYK